MKDSPPTGRCSRVSRGMREARPARLRPRSLQVAGRIAAPLWSFGPRVRHLLWGCICWRSACGGSAVVNVRVAEGAADMGDGPVAGRESRLDSPFPHGGSPGWDTRRTPGRGAASSHTPGMGGWALAGKETGPHREIHLCHAGKDPPQSRSQDVRQREMHLQPESAPAPNLRPASSLGVRGTGRRTGSERSRDLPACLARFSVLPDSYASFAEAFFFGAAGSGCRYLSRLRASATRRALRAGKQRGGNIA